MKSPCPACQHVMSGTKSKIGYRVACPECNHQFYWTDQQHSGESFVIYDLETTGLSAEYDEIIQVAAMRFTSGELCHTETFASYARPRCRISSFIESYTGVTNQHVKDAKRPEEVLCEFAAWCGESTLIAHNGLKFDSKFLTATCHRLKKPTREVHGIDSIHLSKMCFGRVRGIGHSLDHLIARLGINVRGIRRHDARGDVEILGHAVASLYARLELDRALNGVSRHRITLPM